jgi:hypothetical protein
VLVVARQRQRLRLPPIHQFRVLLEAMMSRWLCDWEVFLLNVGTHKLRLQVGISVSASFMVVPSILDRRKYSAEFEVDQATSSVI